MIKHHILIIGSTGLVGAAAVEHFSRIQDWQVTAVARRTLPFPDSVRQLQIDLTDKSACVEGLSAVRGVTHVLYTALYEKPNLVASWRDEEQMATNLSMLRNVLDVLDRAAPELRHITLLQGAKAYGLHLGPTPVPCKERVPRHPHKNFYWLQEDLLRERKAHRGWTFSILRPQLVLGTVAGTPMNIVLAIGAFAAIQRELGRPLCFPGGAYGVYGASDSRLIAKAAEFVGTHEICGGETYNIVNGDVFAWKDIWPGIARHFGMEAGEPEPLCLADAMPRHEEVWGRIAKRHALKQTSLAKLLDRSWQFADRAFGYGFEYPPHSVLDGLKLRSHGFNEFLDTEDAIAYWLRRLQEEQVLPH
ncbi:SDR family oxidoreductase [Variovorax sp. CF079]|uniref:NAD-dependent epimerase/dehydratase family protein n=1 Tax=Variovorax sp. CF079 TaxID=1882774 RepID=UPI000B810058